MTPQPGQIYRTPEGRPMLYVRTEKRPGAKVPEHLFTTVQGRFVFSCWLEELPPELELIVDTEGQRRANEAQALLQVSEHNGKLLIGLLKQACEWLPKERADELRAQYARQAIRVEE